MNLPTAGLYVDAWKAMEKLLADGYVRAIVVSSFAPTHLDRLAAEMDTVPAVNRMQLPPGIARPIWRADSHARGIAIQSWSPLGRARNLAQHNDIAAMAQRHGRTPGQILLRWHVELGLCPIARSSNPDQLQQNTDVFDFALTAEDLGVLSTFDRTEQSSADPERLQPM